MYHLLISDESELDILDGFAWYEKKLPGLGKEFERCLAAGLNQILKYPLLYQKRYKDLRVHFIERFPIGIHFLVEKDTIRVFSVFHTCRNPASWKSRLKQS